LNILILLNVLSVLVGSASALDRYACIIQEALEDLVKESCSLCEEQAPILATPGAILIFARSEHKHLVGRRHPIAEQRHVT
jgi:hypothetical protein